MIAPARKYHVKYCEARRGQARQDSEVHLSFEAKHTPSFPSAANPAIVDTKLLRLVPLTTSAPQGIDRSRTLLLLYRLQPRRRRRGEHGPEPLGGHLVSEKSYHGHRHGSAELEAEALIEDARPVRRSHLPSRRQHPRRVFGVRYPHALDPGLDDVKRVPWKPGATQRRSGVLEDVGAFRGSGGGGNTTAWSISIGEGTAVGKIRVIVQPSFAACSLSGEQQPPKRKNKRKTETQKGRQQTLFECLVAPENRQGKSLEWPQDAARDPPTSHAVVAAMPPDASCAATLRAPLSEALTPSLSENSCLHHSYVANHTPCGRTSLPIVAPRPLDSSPDSPKERTTPVAKAKAPLPPPAPPPPPPAALRTAPSAS